MSQKVGGSNPTLLRYAWAIFDYISPVPRDEDDNFYNAEVRRISHAFLS